MHQLTQSVAQKRSWLFGPVITKASLHSATNSELISAEQITTFTLALLSEFKEILPCLSTRIGDSETVLNLRGRPEETFSSRSTAIRQKQEELCFIAGEMSPPPDEDDPERECEAASFSLAINTRFEKITPKEITHSILFSPTGALVQWRDQLSALTLAKAPLLKITTFRLGFEYFAPSLFGSMLGSIPTIRSRFYLLVDEDGISLSIESEKRENSLFSAESLLETSKRLLSESKIATVSPS